MSINKAILIGRLGKDPDVKSLSSGNSVALFSVATSESFKDKSGQKQEKTQWHNIVAWGKLAEFCGKWLKKGKEVYIEGRIETRSYGEEKPKKYITEIIADKIQFIGNYEKKDESHTDSAQCGVDTSSSEADDLPF